MTPGDPIRSAGTFRRAAVTLSQGIEVALRESVPEITRVIDVTDHAAGTNPYYEAAKK
jgi:Fe/S biogenesis protein NfuA